MGQGCSRHPVDVLVVGLDNSGKTTVVDWLANKSSRSVGNEHQPADTTLPTVGFTARQFKIAKTPVTVLDMSGQGRYRSLWRYYLRQCDGIVYVVDSGDATRLPVAFAELRHLLTDRALVRRRPRLPLLVFANKSDRPSKVNLCRFSDAVCTNCRKTQRPYRVVPSCALTGDGLRLGFDWLATQVAATKPRWYKDNKPTWYCSCCASNGSNMFTTQAKKGKCLCIKNE